MARPSNKEERQGQIVNGLMKAMSKYGYDGASIQLIAKESELTAGLIHYHFKSKEEILLALVNELSLLISKRVKQISSSNSTAEKKLDGLIDAYLSVGQGASSLAVSAWVAICAEAVKKKEVSKVYSSVLKERKKLIESTVTEVLKSQSKSEKNVKKLSAGVVALIEGAFLVASGAPDLMPKGYAADVAKKMIRGFIDNELSEK